MRPSRRIPRIIRTRRRWLSIGLASLVVSVVGVVAAFGFELFPLNNSFGAAERDLLLEVHDSVTTEPQIADLLEARTDRYRRMSRSELGGIFGDELASGNKFYRRYLNTAFPDLPDFLFVTVVRLRGVDGEVASVGIELVLERPGLAVFWDYDNYGNVRHAREFSPPSYVFAIDPVYSAKWVKIFILSTEPIAEPRVNVQKWMR